MLWCTYQHDWRLLGQLDVGEVAGVVDFELKAPRSQWRFEWQGEVEGQGTLFER